MNIEVRDESIYCAKQLLSIKKVKNKPILVVGFFMLPVKSITNGCTLVEIEYETNFNLQTCKFYMVHHALTAREGGSLPALAEADDDFKYVLKFRGARVQCQSLNRRVDWWWCPRFRDENAQVVFANLDEAFGRARG
jgi:hypothetical protein